MILNSELCQGGLDDAPQSGATIRQFKGRLPSDTAIRDDRDVRRTTDARFEISTEETVSHHMQFSRRGRSSDTYLSVVLQV